MTSAFADTAWWVPLLLAVAALLAGWVDAIVGGGGLIQLPAVLLMPGFTPVMAVATNKVGSIAGTTASAITYHHRLRPDMRIAAPLAGVAFIGALGGALLASHLPTSVFTPVIMVALAGVLVFVLVRPDFGSDEGGSPLAPGRALARVLPFGLLVGVYDGTVGPGTGSFLVIGIAALTHVAFLHATAITKIVNAATNLGALVFFIPLGVVHWRVGILLAVANTAGGYLGARTAVRLGSRFVRIVLIVVVVALLARLGWQEFTA